MTDVPDISDESEPLSPDDIAATLAFFPEFKDPDFSPGCVVEKEGVFPWFEHGPSVSAFLRTLYTRNVIVMFERTGWRNEALDYYHHPDHLETADPAPLRRLLSEKTGTAKSISSGCSGAGTSLPSWGGSTVRSPGSR